jgi:DedD protein
MDEGLKRRLIGAAVLASLAVIFVPMLFEDPPSRPPPLPPLPMQPPAQDFASDMLRDEVPAVTPLAPREPAPEVVVAQPPPVTARVPPATSAPAPAAVVAPAPEQPAKPRTGLTAWVVQAASLSSQENAEKLVARLREAKLPTADPELVDIKGKRFYRVRVGPVVERAEADGMVDKVSEIAGTKAQVQQYP